MGAAYTLGLSPNINITIYESRETLGGHANTVKVKVDKQDVPLDTGFLVYNENTYPNLCGLFEVRHTSLPLRPPFRIHTFSSHREVPLHCTFLGAWRPYGAF